MIIMFTDDNPDKGTETNFEEYNKNHNTSVYR